MNKKHIFLLIGGILCLPLIVTLLLEFPLFSLARGEVGSWIGFWGSYLGNIIGLIGLSYATYFQIQYQQKLMLDEIHSQNELEKKRIYVEIILNKLNDYLLCLNQLDNSIAKFHKVFSEHVDAIQQLQQSYSVNPVQMIINNDENLVDIIFNLSQLQSLKVYLEQETLSLNNLKDITELTKKMIRDFQKMKDTPDKKTLILSNEYKLHKKDLKELLKMIQSEKDYTNSHISAVLKSEFIVGRKENL